jgi:hypothetical protein
MYRLFFSFIAFICAGLAAPLTVTVNTTATAGAQGLVVFDIQAGGLDALEVVATITNFQPQAILTGAVTTDGNVTGDLGSTLALSNQSAVQSNFFQQLVTFGTGFSFQFELSGPALNPASPVSSGSTFSFFVLTCLDQACTMLDTPLLDPSLAGLPLGQFDILPEGDVVETAYTDAYRASQVPEPGSFLLAAAGLGGLALLRRRR